MRLGLDGRSAPLTVTEELSLDVAGALDFVNGDNALLEEIIELFHSDYPGWVAELRAAIRSDDAQSTERAAHSLKGAVRIFGVTAADNLANELETLGRAIDLTGAETVLPMFERELGQLNKALFTMGLATRR
jgi:two-component system sensor histidine kinase/response regulator